MKKALYTIKEAQEYIGLSRASIYKLVGLGHIKTVRILTRNLCTAESLEALRSGGANDNG